MKILKYDSAKYFDKVEDTRRIEDYTDEELNEMGWRRLAKIPGVVVAQSTIEGRLRRGWDKRAACITPPMPGLKSSTDRRLKAYERR